MELSKKRFFVTGGAGYIASHLVDKLMEYGDVTIYDNLSSGRKEFFSHHEDKGNFRFIEGDILDKEALSSAIKDHDIVFHFAANPDVLLSLKETDLDFKQGALATLNVLEAMNKNNIKNIVFSSSGTVWGLTGKEKATEESPLKPISLYAASKVSAESYIRAFCHIFGFKAWIFRFANVVGDRQTHGVIHDFIIKLRKDPKNLEILGDGNQTKHYLHTSDCIGGILFAVENSDQEVNVFNLANEGAVTVKRIADLITEEMNLKDVTYSYTGGSQGWKGDVPISLFNAEKIKNLGWKAGLNSEQAVRETIRSLLEDKYHIFKNEF